MATKSGCYTRNFAAICGDLSPRPTAMVGDGPKRGLSRLAELGGLRLDPNGGALVDLLRDLL